ncbi:MAG: glycosyltransferase family 2 protein [Propionicimonas sp.]
MTVPGTPKVTVIIPVYNTGRFLDECIGSLFDQTLPQSEIEIVAVDDGSKDDSLEVLQRLASEHENLRVMHQDASGSAAKPRNVGIEAARGEYLFFLDSDDYLAPDALGELVRVADESGSGVVLPRMDTFGTDRNRASTTVRETALAVDFVESGAYRTYHPGKLFRASIVRQHGLRFPTGYRIGEDMAFTLSAYFHSPHVSMLGDKPYYHLRWRNDQSSLRQAGQTAPEVLAKNETMVRIVQRLARSESDRIMLLQRCVVGRGGLWVLFTEPYLEQFDPAAQQEVFQHVHSLLADAWKPAYRRQGSLKAHIMTSLLWRGDLEAVREFSRLIASGAEIPLRPGRPWRRQPAYVASTGTVVRDALDEKALKKLLAERQSRASGTVR